MLGMNNVDLVTRLSWMIEQAKKGDNMKLANALVLLQMEVINERSREWDKGYNTGYALGVKELRLRDRN